MICFLPHLILFFFASQAIEVLFDIRILVREFHKIMLSVWTDGFMISTAPFVGLDIKKCWGGRNVSPFSFCIFVLKNSVCHPDDTLRDDPVFRLRLFLALSL